MSLPLLDESRCAGTGECVRLCPAGCLEMDGVLPWLPRPMDCVECAICREACPTAAIKMDDGAAPVR